MLQIIRVGYVSSALKNYFVHFQFYSSLRIPTRHDPQQNKMQNRYHCSSQNPAQLSFQTALLTDI